MNVLFVAGPARSGTTALTDYLNVHPQILVCRERYKFAIPGITPDYFTPEKVLGSRKGETSMPAAPDAGLFERKDLSEVVWIGDKNPNYVSSMALLLKNNPGARFILTYRPVEEVAESHDERARDPRGSWLKGQNGFEVGVRAWNTAMRKTRRFIEGGLEDGLRPNALIISYHDFFGERQEDCARLLSRFLDLDFDDEIVAAWRTTSSSFEGERREKDPPTDEQQAYLDANKDTAAEAWVLNRLEGQWKELDVEAEASGRRVVREVADSGLLEAQAEEEARAEEIKRLRHRVRRLQENLARERRAKRRLRLRASNLEQRLEDIECSTFRRLVRKLAGVRARLKKVTGT